MEWQLYVVGALVIAAGAYVARQTWRTWHPPHGSCGGGCGCATKKTEASTRDRATLIPTEQLTLRRRSS